jgi:hypothetical protein
MPIHFYYINENLIYGCYLILNNLYDYSCLI